MKKILFLALALVATASCKRDVDFPSNNPVEPEQGVEIALSAGTGSASSTKTAVADKGEREIFILSDKIGLYAAYKVEDNPAAGSDPATYKPDWGVNNEETQTGIYFANKPAICTTAGARATEDPFTATPAKFGWGTILATPGGRDITQTYPRNSKDIYLFAYYPYDASTENATMTTAGPVIKLTLNEVSAPAVAPVGAGGEAEGPVVPTPVEVLIHTGNEFVPAQSDVLYSQAISAGDGATPAVLLADQPYINRLNKLKALEFKHALAQLNVKISREEGAAQAWLIDLKFKTYLTADMELSHDAAKLGKISPTGNANAVTYTIAPDLTQGAFQILSTQTQLIDRHLMVFPLSSTNLGNCALEVTVYYSGEAPTEIPIDNKRTFIIPLKGLKVKDSDATPKDFALEAGMLNEIELELTTADINITGVITAWDEAGSTGDITVE